MQINGQAVQIEPEPPGPRGPTPDCDLCRDRGSVIRRGRGEDACPVCAERAETAFQVR